MMRWVRRHAKHALCAVLLAGFVIPAAQAACTDSPGPGVDWTKCQKRRLILRGANLENARLDSTDLGRSDLSAAKLIAANLERAAIDSARLIGADLSRAHDRGPRRRRGQSD